MKIGIIGMGYAGRLHLKAIEKLHSDITCYIYDVTVHVAQQFEKTHKCRAVNTIDELYDKVDAVIVATPTCAHYNLAMQAMQRGKHVLCEKPMSFTVTESEEMLNLCKTKNLTCAIGFNYRFFDITEIFKNKDQIGETCCIKISIKRLFRDDWHNDKNGVLSDLGIHLIDYITYLCNQKIIFSTCRVTKKYIGDWDYDSNVRGETEKGISFDLTASRTNIQDDVHFSVELIGTEGIMKYDSRKDTVYIIEKKNILHSHILNKDKKNEDFFDFTNSILRQDEAWIRAILGKNERKIATFEDGFQAQKALDFFLSDGLYD